MRPFPLKMNNKGLSLVEVIVAVFILAIVAGPLLGVFATNAQLVQTAYQRTDTTYDLTGLMEGLYGKTYGQLYNETEFPAGSRKPHAASGKYIIWQFAPAGPADVVSGKPCFAHLIIQSDGSGFFVGFDGQRKTTSTSSDYSTVNVSFTPSTGSYSLRVAGTTISATNNTDLKNKKPVFIISTQSINKKVTITNPGVTALMYAPPDLAETNITASNDGILYNNDIPASSALVHAKLFVYNHSSDASPASVFQNTLTVSTAP